MAKQNKSLLDIEKASSLSVVAFTGIAMVSAWYYYYYYGYRRKELDLVTDNNKDRRESKHSIFLSSHLPGHLKRMLYKEHRRKESVRFLAMKKPLYDNIEMYTPGNELLCTISEKKAYWYVRKKLAVWREPLPTTTQKVVQSQQQDAGGRGGGSSSDCYRSIQLTFEPKAKSSSSSNSSSNPLDLYNRSHKQNICVVCGDFKHQQFMRHYVVPYCYRTLFPTHYKTHMPHDIVLLCPDCHLGCNQATQLRQNHLDTNLRRKRQQRQKSSNGNESLSDRPYIHDRNLYKVKSVAQALVTHRERLPLAKIQEYESILKNHFLGSESSLDWTDTLLNEAMAIEPNVPNPNYIPSANLVVRELAHDDDSIATFIRGWRQHFVETMQPQFLPKGWSIDSPVRIGE